jgi:hypothetical protein
VTKHLTVRVETSEEKPMYKAICGYEGENKKEFTDPMRGTWADVTCEECLAKREPTRETN